MAVHGPVRAFPVLPRCGLRSAARTVRTVELAVRERRELVWEWLQRGVLWGRLGDVADRLRADGRRWGGGGPARPYGVERHRHGRGGAMFNVARVRLTVSPSDGGSVAGAVRGRRRVRG